MRRLRWRREVPGTVRVVTLTETFLNTGAKSAVAWVAGLVTSHDDQLVPLSGSGSTRLSWARAAAAPR
jgi:hypothetical protein